MSINRRCSDFPPLCFLHCTNYYGSFKSVYVSFLKHGGSWWFRRIAASTHGGLCDDKWHNMFLNVHDHITMRIWCFQCRLFFHVRSRSQTYTIYISDVDLWRHYVYRRQTYFEVLNHRMNWMNSSRGTLKIINICDNLGYTALGISPRRHFTSCYFVLWLPSVYRFLLPAAGNGASLDCRGFKERDVFKEESSGKKGIKKTKLKGFLRKWIHKNIRKT